jgi:hypothetical protein
MKLKTGTYFISKFSKISVSVFSLGLQNIHITAKLGISTARKRIYFKVEHVTVFPFCILHFLMVAL